MYATQASVVIVKPAGTRSGPRIRVISATLAPLPPMRSRMSRPPSSKAYTHLVSVTVAMAPITSENATLRNWSTSDRYGANAPQAHVPVVLDRLADRAVDLPQCRPGGARHRRQRMRQRVDHEAVRLFGQ